MARENGVNSVANINSEIIVPLTVRYSSLETKHIKETKPTALGP